MNVIWQQLGKERACLCADACAALYYMWGARRSPPPSLPISVMTVKVISERTVSESFRRSSPEKAEGCRLMDDSHVESAWNVDHVLYIATSSYLLPALTSTIPVTRTCTILVLYFGAPAPRRCLESSHRNARASAARETSADVLCTCKVF